MLELDSYNSFHNFKCGEIYCTSPEVFNVTCLLCPRKMLLQQFSSHFVVEHLTLAEKVINFKDLERKRKSKLAKDVALLLDNMTTKDEDPEEDPIRQEDGLMSRILTDNEDQDEEDKCLQQLINENSKHNEFVEKHKYEIEINEKLCFATSSFSRNTVKIQEDDSKKDATEMETLLLAEYIETTEGGLIVDADADGLNKDDLCNEGEEHSRGSDSDDDWTYKGENSNTDTDKNTKDELPFSCPICKRSYRTKHGLQKHNHSVHNPNKPPRIVEKPKLKHKCDECNHVFRSARQLEGHKLKHQGIVCDVCGKSFTLIGSLVRHKIRHTGIKSHKCKECSKDFFTTKELQSHMLCHTGSMPYICEICGKKCRHSGVLKAHMRRHTGERPAKCDVCGKNFFCVHDLNVHAVTHSSERPFECDVCGSTFQRKKALRIHKRIHSKDRKHVCKICGKGFAQSSGLNSHMRSHNAAVEKSTAALGCVYLPTATFEHPNTDKEKQISAASTASTAEIVVNRVAGEDVHIVGEYD